MAHPDLLITGASGFVGGALLRRLLRDGRAVRAALRDPAALPVGAQTCSVGELSGATDWSKALQGIRTVVHCSARAHVMRDRARDPAAEFRRVNTDATLNLARQAAAAGAQRLVFVSSVHVNGLETFERPFTEDDVPAPCSPYAESKLQAELGLRALAAETGMQVVVVRPPLVYGPGAKGNWARMLRWLEAGIPLPLGGIDNRRSLIGLDNLVDVLVACADRPTAGSELFLVSDGEDVSTSELLRRLGAALGRSARLYPLPMGSVRVVARWLGQEEAAQRLCGSLQVDASRVRKVLGWRPPLTLDEGLRRVAEQVRGQAVV
jgi:UDP-glucose 4-epimerase